MSVLKIFIEKEKVSSFNVGVIGDAMIDQYFDVSVKKISPEFPIPVMHSLDDSSHDLPGGAANVVYQFRNFNFNVNLFSLIDDHARSVFEDHGIDCGNSVTIDQKIPRKRRFYSDNHPTYRWDVEKSFYGLNLDKFKKTNEKLFRKCIKQSSKLDALIMSDYDKGLFSVDRFLINDLISRIPITVVDPKAGDPQKWIGCTVLKPNAKEATSLAECSDLKKAGFILLEKARCKNVIITRSADGILIFNNEGLTEIKPDRVLPSAESVIGAGDCFTAFLTMSLLNGFDIYQASEIAWNLGSMYVMNRRNKPLTRSDITDVYDVGIKKILSVNDLDVFKNRNYKLIFTNGCFDILHAGHIELLKFAKQQGDKLIVGLNSDHSVSKIKKGRPFVNQNDRIKILSSLEYIDYICVFNEKTPINLIKKIKPDVLVKGSEYSIDNIVGKDIVGKVLTCPMVEGLSTTNLIEKIKNS